jgi:hypothetical protein
MVMKIALLVPRIHFHAPFVLRALEVRARSGEDRYVAVLTPKLSPRQEPTIKKLGDLVQTSGFHYVRSMAFDRSREMVLGNWERMWGLVPEVRRFLSVGEACRIIHAELIPVRSVREPYLVERLRTFAPDIMCAVFFNQIVPASLRALARLGAINVHPSCLPQYRGVSPCFWALARGERYCGVTIHTMTDEIDRGPILAQRRIEILPEDTLHSLYRRCAIAGGEPLVDLLAHPERIENPHDTPEDEGTYFARITPEAVREFRERGRKFF